MKFFKKFLILIFSIIFTTCIFACSNSNVPKNNENNLKSQGDTQKTTYPFKMKDSLNREITIKKEPEKVVSLAPNITETIFAIDAQKKLIGRTEFCTYPKEAKEITSVGSIQEPSIEKIADLKPDLVIASTHFKKDTLKKLESLGIDVISLKGEETFEGTYNIIEKVGKILNHYSNSIDVVSNMKKKVDFVTSKVSKKNKPSVYYVVGFGKSGDYTPGKDTFIGKAINMAGAKNAGEDAVNWKFSLEKLMEKNPDIIICSKYFNTKQGLETTNGYKDLKAVKDKHLYEIDNNLLDRQGPRLADGLEALAKIIHPEAFK